MYRVRSLAVVLVAVMGVAAVDGDAIAATPTQKQAAGRAFTAAGRNCSALPSDIVLLDISGRREVYQTFVNGSSKTKTCIAICENNTCTVR